MFSIFKILIFYSLLISLFCLTKSKCFAIDCPTYTHQRVLEGQQELLPDGFFIYADTKNPGVYISEIRSFSPHLLSSTKNDNPYDISISPNGNWVLYRSNGIPYLSHISSKRKIKIPIKTTTANSVCFWRNKPGNTQSICYMPTFHEIRSINFELYDDTVLFFQDKPIALLDDSLQIRPQTRLCISANHIFATMHPLYNAGFAYWWMFYLTLNNDENIVANRYNIYKWEYEPFTHKGGCGHAMSWDGTLCAADVGLTSLSPCLPRYHKGFTITPFWEVDQPAQNMAKSVDSHAISMNWCPERFRNGDASEQNFWDWYFGNSNDYIIGNQLGELAPRHGIWLVRWKDNEWTYLTDSTKLIEAYQPAIHFCKFDTIKIDTCTKTTSSEIPSVEDPLNPKYKVIGPNGGEVYYIGDTIKIKIKSVKDLNTWIKITISGGKNWIPLFDAGVNPLKDSILNVILTTALIEEWSNGTNNSEYKLCSVRIENYGDAKYNDKSDGFFTIYNAAKPSESERSHKKDGCGNGFGLAFIFPVSFKLRHFFKSKKWTKKS